MTTLGDGKAARLGEKGFLEAIFVALLAALRIPACSMIHIIITLVSCGSSSYS